MACNVTLAGNITYSCDDVAIGGIVKLALVNKADLLATGGGLAGATISATTREISGTIAAQPAAPTALGGIAISFNNKDGFSVFSEVKTVSADGVVSCVPTISVELPKMTPAKIEELNIISKGGAELVALVETAAGTYHVVGMDYGLYAGTIDGNSGTGRSEKNRFQLTLTGDELGLGYFLAETTGDLGKANWETLTGTIFA
tara:strand:- start:756 stop:1361 length:606 start_codon:yes stop_codon:yes gene_type:complete